MDALGRDMTWIIVGVNVGSIFIAVVTGNVLPPSCYPGTPLESAELWRNQRRVRRESDQSALSPPSMFL
jgi:hypothetical protein